MGLDRAAGVEWNVSLCQKISVEEAEDPGSEDYRLGYSMLRC